MSSQVPLIAALRVEHLDALDRSEVACYPPCPDLPRSSLHAASQLRGEPLALVVTFLPVFLSLVRRNHDRAFVERLQRPANIDESQFYFFVGLLRAFLRARRAGWPLLESTSCTAGTSRGGSTLRSFD